MLLYTFAKISEIQLKQIVDSEEYSPVRQEMLSCLNLVIKWRLWDSLGKGKSKYKQVLYCTQLAKEE
jgi:hypothetical protein